MKSKKITLADICFIEKGKIGIQAAIPGNYPLVTTGAERSTNNEYHFEGEAVCIPLVSATGHGHASIKRIHFQKGKFCVGNILCACIPKDYTKTSAKFLYLYFSLLKDVLLVPLMQGSANVSLKIKDLEKVEVPNISFERQLEIVQEFECLDIINKKLINELDQQQNYLQHLLQTILQEAVQGKLTKQSSKDEPATELLKRIKAEKQKLINAGKLKKEKELPPITEDEIPFELPKGWVWCTIGEAIEFSDNLNIETNLPKDAIINYVDIDAIDNKKYTIREAKQKKVFELSSRARRVLKKGYIVYSLVRPYLNNIAIVQETKPNYIGSTGFAVFKGVIVDNEYLKILLLSEYIRTKYLNFLKGFNSPSITQEQFTSTYIPLPPLAEQHRIVAKVQQLQKQLSQLEMQVQQSRQYAQQLLQSVLKEAFEEKGKVYEMEEERAWMVAEE